MQFLRWDYVLAFCVSHLFDVAIPFNLHLVCSFAIVMQVLRWDYILAFCVSRLFDVVVSRMWTMFIDGLNVFSI